MTVSRQKVIRVSAPFAQTIEWVQQALTQMGVAISHVDMDQGLVMAKKGLSWKSFGEDIRVTVIPTDSGCDVQASSESTVSLTAVDWGANADNMNVLEQTLHRLEGQVKPRNLRQATSPTAKIPTQVPKPIDTTPKKPKVNAKRPVDIDIEPPGPRDASSPIRILFLAANPTDTTSLRLDEEVRTIDQALRQSEYRDKFELEQQWAVRVIDIQSHLLRYKPDIVHFSGHGSESSEIILEGSQGKGVPVPRRALSQLFSVLKDNIRCVVLNACYSEQQAQAIAAHIDCVVGMSKAIGDQAAIGFAASFYQALGYGKDIKTAFELGCVQIDLEGLNEQDTPKLLATRCDPKKSVFVRSE